MAVVAFCSATGAPGVSTVATLTAALWPRPAVVLDADPSGGDVALRLGSRSGGEDSGMLRLLTAARHGLDAADVLAETRTLDGGLPVISGLGRPEQAEAARTSWTVLAGAVRAAGTATDLMVDTGRLGSPSSAPTAPLLAVADLVVVVLTPELAALAHTRTRAVALADVLTRSGGTVPVVAPLVVGGTRRDAGTAVAVLQDTARRSGLGVLDLSPLPHDPAGAAVFAGTPGPRPERTALVRAGRGLVRALAEHLDHLAHLAHLATAPPTAVPSLTGDRP
ncbi:hypothetical protein ACFFKU_00105 [Kineococcus gynurae]|uniref:MinD-like ATPase involved in chromosome partitioning or flagellar assembly n=1 Tax=Kineococcus gynurae TaxID=452979 RepID=A0ABV5LXP4_9ACTN